MPTTNPYHSAALLLWLAAALHAAAPILGAPTGYLIWAGLYALLAMGLMRGMRWVSYIAFLVAGIGGGIMLGWYWVAFGLFQWWSLLATAICWIAAIALFGALWHAPANQNGDRTTG
jgi:hypothetical protein